MAMKARFIIGPAGSGKTHQCLAEIRAQLRRSPAGPPLILIAPKQATFQLERELLSDDRPAAFSRLHILSFDRLAHFVLKRLGVSVPPLLDEEGRVMVLRALLERRRESLRLFRASARMPGFAGELSSLFRELQRHHAGAARLRATAGNLDAAHATLRDKLEDLADLLEALEQWTHKHGVADADCILDLAAGALREAQASGVPGFQLDGVWMDGFAEMTPQEMSLLLGLSHHSPAGTFCFCLEDAEMQSASRLSTWHAIGGTFRRCLAMFEAASHVETTLQVLERRTGNSRYNEGSVLEHVERHWAEPVPFTGGDAAPELTVVSCRDVDAEAAFAAGTIRSFVREGGGRYRDCAVLLRTLEGFEAGFRRAFERYEIPFFMDRRESAAHHPLAELTRSALRIVSSGWEAEDVIALLKTGLTGVGVDDVDWLENEILARGWSGEFWRSRIAIPEPGWLAVRAEAIRSKWAPALLHFESSIAGGRRDGRVVAAAFRKLWDEFDIESRLLQWAECAGDMSHPGPESPSAIHATVWQQMLGLMDNVERGFRDDPLPLREWMQVLDAGLSSLTVGAVPPSLDQVLIGAIDRSRNPDLSMVVLSGMNEGIFPARTSARTLLTERDRLLIEDAGVSLGATARLQASRERYYGYIACTRARERLVVTFSRRDEQGRQVNPSIFIPHLQRLFPVLQIEDGNRHENWCVGGHVCELAAGAASQMLFQNTPSVAVPRPPGREGGPPPAFFARLSDMCVPARRLSERLGMLSEIEGDERLSPEMALALYSPSLSTSVSGMEQFAMCPFRFFVNAGMRARERKLFELDARQRGDFQHVVLSRFHESVLAEGRRWRDLTVAEARERIAGIFDSLRREHGQGLLDASARSRFAADVMLPALQEFVAANIRWMQDGYLFDPAAAELQFGGEDASLESWRLELEEGRCMVFQGKIDRVDVFREASTGDTWLVVVDYKSRGKKIDAVLQSAGVQIQLPAYLAALSHAQGLPDSLNAAAIKPAGLIYLDLSRRSSREAHRLAGLNEEADGTQQKIVSDARMNMAALGWLDANAKPGQTSRYLPFRLTKQGVPYRRATARLQPQERFVSVLSSIELTLRTLGGRIYEGRAEVDPYRTTNSCACDYCQFKGVCRIDPWTHVYRTPAPVALLPCESTDGNDQEDAVSAAD